MLTSSIRPLVRVIRSPEPARVISPVPAPESRHPQPPHSSGRRSLLSTDAMAAWGITARRTPRNPAEWKPYGSMRRRHPHVARMMTATTRPAPMLIHPGVSNAIPTMAISVMAKQSRIPGCNVSTLRHSYSSGSATACEGAAMLAGFFCGAGGGTRAMLLPTTVANPNAITMMDIGKCASAASVSVDWLLNSSSRMTESNTMVKAADPVRILPLIPVKNLNRNAMAIAMITTVFIPVISAILVAGAEKPSGLPAASKWVAIGSGTISSHWSGRTVAKMVTSVIGTTTIAEYQRHLISPPNIVLDIAAGHSNTAPRPDSP